MMRRLPKAPEGHSIHKPTYGIGSTLFLISLPEGYRLEYPMGPNGDGEIGGARLLCNIMCARDRGYTVARVYLFRGKLYAYLYSSGERAPLSNIPCLTLQDFVTRLCAIDRLTRDNRRIA